MVGGGRRGCTVHHSSLETSSITEALKWSVLSFVFRHCKECFQRHAVQQPSDKSIGQNIISGTLLKALERLMSNG